jgi:hypothetical protein
MDTTRYADALHNLASLLRDQMPRAHPRVFVAGNDDSGQISSTTEPPTLSSIAARPHYMHNNPRKSLIFAG